MRGQRESAASIISIRIPISAAVRSTQTGYHKQEEVGLAASRRSKKIRSYCPRAKASDHQVRRHSREVCSKMPSKSNDGWSFLAHCESQVCVGAWRHVGRNRSFGARVSPFRQTRYMRMKYLSALELPDHVQAMFERDARHTESTK